MSNSTLTSIIEERFWAKVNKTATCWNWTAAKDFGGYGKYAIIRTNASMAHRVSWELLVAPIPEGMTLDHICHNHACVNPEHLRLATMQENAEYRKGLRPDNTSGYRGVSLHAPNGKWRAKVQHKGRTIHVGLFDTIEEAAAAAKAKRAELYRFVEFAPTA